MKRHSKYTGVYTRESQGEREYKGHPDRCFYITYRKNGRLVWEKMGWLSEGYSAKLAHEIRGERLRSIRHGESLPKEKAKIPSFDEAASIYISWAEKTKRDQSDRARYGRHLKSSLGKKFLNEITSLDLEEVKFDLQKKGLSPASVRHVLQLVRAIYNKMFVWNKYFGMNPAKHVSMPTLDNARVRFLSATEAQMLLQELKRGSSTTHDIALVSLHTGLRAGEIFKLQLQHIDFVHDLLRVMDPKNQTSRVAYFTPNVKTIFQNRMIGKMPEDFVFFPRIHAKSQISRVSGFFQRTADSLFNKDIKDRRHRVVFHSLRHSFASWLAIKGTPLHVIQEVMGHRTLTMTSRYAHLIPDVKREAIKSLPELASAEKKRKTTF